MGFSFVPRLSQGIRDHMPEDDRLTVISISALACILRDVPHEGLGHGVTAWLSGAHRFTVSTVALQSDIETRWIPAIGTLANLACAGIRWLLLLRARRYGPVTRYLFCSRLRGTSLPALATFCFPVSSILATGRQ